MIVLSWAADLLFKICAILSSELKPLTIQAYEAQLGMVLDIKALK